MHPLVDNLVGQFVFGFTDTMMGPHAKEAAGMTQEQVGTAFLLVGLAYMVGSLLTGIVRQPRGQRRNYGTQAPSFKG